MPEPHISEIKRRLVLSQALLDKQKKILDFAATGLVIGTSVLIVGIFIDKVLLIHIGTGMDYISVFFPYIQLTGVTVLADCSG